MNYILERNKQRLIAWQKNQHERPSDGRTRLHIGCGYDIKEGYTNIDIRDLPNVDLVADAKELPYDDDSVDEIVAHHVLEHLTFKDAEIALHEWYRVLKPGGTLELGVPDFDLCVDLMRASPSETFKWDFGIKNIFGCQEDSENHEFVDAQLHRSAYTVRRLDYLLRKTGFKVIEAFPYNGNTIPSAFAYVVKDPNDEFLPDRVLNDRPKLVHPTSLEQDVIMGVFTHRQTYLPQLIESVKTYLPHIHFVVKVNDAPINENMRLLREDFMRSGKRYWIYLDDDIAFLNDTVIHDAVADMIANRWAAVGVYSTFNPDWIKRGYNTAGLVSHEIQFVTGYFIMVDSHLVGDVEPDMGLPDPNTSVDTSYSAEILKRGFKMGISPNVVYHVKKNTLVNQEVIDMTNKYLVDKWGRFYHDNIRYPGNVIEW